MYPILFSIGPIAVYAFSLFLVLAWLVFSFFFWRSLRRFGIPEDRIFDLTFYASLVAFVAARVGFVVTSWEVFSGQTPLLIAALWVAPGLSWSAALLGGMATLVFLSRRYRVRLGLVLDALAVSLPVSLIVGKLGSLLDGSEVGLPANFPWVISYVGHPGRRHPVQLYEIVALALVVGLFVWLMKRAEVHKWPYGALGVWFFLTYSVVSFALEFLKDTRVYWGVLTANQWILIGIFAESIGALYVRGGGKEFLHPKILTLRGRITLLAKEIYAKISRRYTHRDSSIS